MTKWYVQLADGTVRGPYNEGQVKQGIRAGNIQTPMQIRQGNSDWIRADTVRRLFEKLESDGVYLKDEANRVYGPFTRDRLQLMQAADNFPQRYWLRQGKTGPWQRIGPPSPVSSSRPSKTSLARPRPMVIPPAPVMKLRPTPWSILVAHAKFTFGRLLPIQLP